MNRSIQRFSLVLCTLLLFTFSSCSKGTSDQLTIGHPACLSGKYAKAGEQAVGEEGFPAGEDLGMRVAGRGMQMSEVVIEIITTRLSEEDSECQEREMAGVE